MKNLIKLAFTIILAAILFTACSTEDNPIAPVDSGNGGGDPGITMNTPVAMRLSSIAVTNFPLTKPNGDKWDYSIFPNSPTRRPDIYVGLIASGTSNHVFRSTVEEDALLENAYDSYIFTQPASSDGGTFPYNVPLNKTYIIDLMDDDGLSADDWMGNVLVNPSTLYNNDNAEFFTKYLTSGDLRITIKGTWVY